MYLKKLAIGFLLIVLLVGTAGVSAASSAPGIQGFAIVIPDWLRVNDNGFGDQQALEVTALETFDNYLYAGTYNPINPVPGQLYDGAQIFRSSDGVNWNPVTDPGFGNTHDTAPPAILDLTVFKGYLFASTGRGNAAQIWRSMNGVNWARVVNAGFGDPDIVDFTVLIEDTGWLYVGVTKQDSEAQIWRTYTGDGNLSNWIKVAAGTDPARVTGLVAFDFDGGLYAAVQSEAGAPAQIWRSYDGTWGSWTTVINDGFGDSNTTVTGGMAEFGGCLYVGAGNASNGAQLWRTCDGDIWEPAISPGFGDANNQEVQMVSVFQNQLYISVVNPGAGIKLWRSADGSQWERANLDGFDDSYNTATNWSNATAAFLSRLHVGTVNSVQGGELWQMQQKEADLALSKVDAKDPIVVGDPIHYTLTVSNAGPDTAQNIVLTDNLPSGVSYVSATPSQGSCGQAGGIVTCNLGNLASGGSLQVGIVVTSLSVGVKTNQANVVSDTVDPYMTNNNDTETTTVALVLLKSYLPLILR